MKIHRNKLDDKLRNYRKKLLVKEYWYRHDPKCFRKMMNKQERLTNRKYCSDYVNFPQKLEIQPNPVFKKSRGWYTW